MNGRVTTHSLIGGPCNGMPMTFDDGLRTIEAPLYDVSGTEMERIRYTKRRFHKDGMFWDEVWAHCDLTDAEVLDIVLEHGK